MIVYRISSPARAKDLSGQGRKIYGGRWNPKGYPILYTAETSSLAMLEKLVHIERPLLKKSFALTTINMPDHLKISETRHNQLSDFWSVFPSQTETIASGKRWLETAETPVLKMPSALNPQEHNPVACHSSLKAWLQFCGPAHQHRLLFYRFPRD